MINYDNKFLHQFIKTYDVVGKDICNRCIKNVEQSDLWQEHTFYNETDKKAFKESGKDELSVLYYDLCLGKEKKIIMDLIWDTLQKYFNDIDTPWFTGWTGYTAIRFNKYKKNKKMASHCDHIQTIFDGTIRGIPFLSIVGCLNDNYSGGEFIMFDNKEYKIKTGQILIFPSSFMFPHKVNPVTKGIRYSYVSWVY
mgnify:FL=1|tara:strand:- start:90 stop:677 length:588 start_codon:yes stop_codon:yes gene_type:complete